MYCTTQLHAHTGYSNLCRPLCVLENEGVSECYTGLILLLNFNFFSSHSTAERYCSINSEFHSSHLCWKTFSYFDYLVEIKTNFFSCKKISVFHSLPVDCRTTRLENFAVTTSEGEVVASVTSEDECLTACILKVMIYSHCTGSRTVSVQETDRTVGILLPVSDQCEHF